MKTEGCSIWLCLDNETEKWLASIIKELGTKLNTPIFTPHITLLSGMRHSISDILEAVQILTSEFSHFSLDAWSIESANHYFQSLYLKINPDNVLLELRGRAERLLETNRPSPFYPHISLIYGQLNQQTKNNIIQELELRLSGVSLDIEKLVVMDTDGKPERWRRIEAYSLGN